MTSMKFRHIRMAFVAIVLGFLVAYGIYRISRPRTKGRAGPETNFVVAAHDLLMEMTIKDEDVKSVSRPDILRPGCALNKAQVVGQRVMLPVSEGYIVCPSDLAPADEEVDFTQTSMRALWVEISRVAGASPVEKGTRFDVLVTTPTKSGEEQPKTVLKNVLVIAVDEGTHRDTRRTRPTVSVALLVSPEDAHELVRASVHREIQLSRTND